MAVVAIALLVAAVASTVALVWKWPRWRAVERAELAARTAELRRAHAAARREAFATHYHDDLAKRQAIARMMSWPPPRSIPTDGGRAIREYVKREGTAVDAAAVADLVVDICALAGSDGDLVYDPAVWEPKA